LSWVGGNAYRRVPSSNGCQHRLRGKVSLFNPKTCAFKFWRQSQVPSPPWGSVSSSAKWGEH
jgi:hypothetical protein